MSVKTAAARGHLALLAGIVALAVACGGGTDAAPGAERATTPSPPSTALAPPSTAPAPPSTAPAPPSTTPAPPPPTTASTTTAAPETTSTSTSTTTTVPATDAGSVPAPAPTITAPAVTAVPAAAWTVPQAAFGPHTSCRQVAHIGDSTSEHLWEASTVGGDADATMEARYRDIGVEEVYNDTSGGRSIVERINRQQRNATEVAEDLRASGFHGCWVLMIGTNDAANVAAGANLGLDARIESLLAVIGGDPVLWVNTASSSDIAWYGDDSMQAFNAALGEAATRHPNLWVLDWAAVVRPEWYGPDGLHHNAAGRAWRSALTAEALADAFPG
jgi:lysophospholipase L1-like esterase